MRDALFERAYPRARRAAQVRVEPPRDYRRRVNLSYATNAGRSSEA
jgi:hypothetical protein